MHRKILFVTLFSFTLTTCMQREYAQGASNPHYPPRQSMAHDRLTQLMDIVPPMRMTMDDYAIAAQDNKNWLHTDEELAIFSQILTESPLYQQICADPTKHAELIDSMISETKQRVCSHVGSCCYALISPCTPAIWSAFFAIRAYKAAHRGEGCCAECGMSCFLAVASCGRCSKSAKSMRGITKTTHKTCKALEIFKALKQSSSSENLEKDE